MPATTVPRMEADEDAAVFGSPMSWSQVPVADKREVFRLAHLGKRHPSPEVSNVATAWVHRDAMAKWWNRAPGWLLPLLGVLAVVGGISSDMIVLVVGSALVIVFGVLGWSTTRSTALLRDTYGK